MIFARNFDRALSLKRDSIPTDSDYFRVQVENERFFSTSASTEAKALQDADDATTSTDACGGGPQDAAACGTGGAAASDGAGEALPHSHLKDLLGAMRKTPAEAAALSGGGGLDGPKPAVLELRQSSINLDKVRARIRGIGKEDTATGAEVGASAAATSGARPIGQSCEIEVSSDEDSGAEGAGTMAVDATFLDRQMGLVWEMGSFRRAWAKDLLGWTYDKSWWSQMRQAERGGMRLRKQTKKKL